MLITLPQILRLCNNVTIWKDVEGISATRDFFNFAVNTYICSYPLYPKTTASVHSLRAWHAIVARDPCNVGYNLIFLSKFQFCFRSNSARGTNAASNL